MHKRNRIIAVLLMACIASTGFFDDLTAHAEDVQDTVISEVETPKDSEAEQEKVSDEILETDDSEEESQVSSEEKSQMSSEEESQASSEEEAVQDEDPGQGRLAGNVPPEFYGSGIKARASSGSYGSKHDDRFVSYNKLKGVDVSKWNANINWSKVKAAGIDFVFVRVGYTGLDSGSLNTDPYAAANLKNAAAAGIKVGAYFYSQAATEAKAKQEMEYMLKLVKNYNITMPLVFDYEYYYYNGVAGNQTKKMLKLTDSKRTKICLAAMDTIKAAGYTPMLYANKSMLEDDLNVSQIDSKYKIWLARYNSYAGYDRAYEYWQYTDVGKVSGISGVVDMNYWYTKTESSSAGTKPEKVTAKAAAEAKDKIKITWDKVSGVSGYIVYRYDSSAKTYKRIKVVSSGTTSYTDTGRSSGTTYKYKVKAYKKVDGVSVYGTASDAVSAKTLSSTSSKPSSSESSKTEVSVKPQTGKTNGTSIIVRKGPSTKNTKLTTLGINRGVTIIGKTGDWYKVTLKINGKKRTGYILKKYVSIVRKPKLSASAYSKTKIKLKWTKSSGASGYQIQRYNSSKKTWQTVKTITKGSSTSYINSGLKKNKTYKYRIRAYKKVRGKKIYSYYCDSVSKRTKK